MFNPVMAHTARWIRAATGAAAALLLVGTTPLARATDAPVHPTGPDFAAIDAYVEAEMRADRVPGAALALVRGDQVVHLRGFGDDGTGRPVTPRTAFLLGSMSKPFTALAIMQLVEQGRIDLDAPVQRYLPWFRVADADASARITVRHLLHHTSGIPERAPHATGAPLTIEAHVRALAGVRLNHTPGAVHEYASPNYLVLGAILEQVTGQPYAEYVRQHIFAPLGMHHSFTSQAEAQQAGTMARGHRYWFGVPLPAVLAEEPDRLPTAALISSVEDLARFLVAQLNWGRFGERAVLSPAGMAELHQPAAPADGFSYAMGWRVGEIRGTPTVHHGGTLPHFRGKLVVLPREGWGVVVLTNVSSVLPLSPTSHRMADAIAGALAGAPLPAAGSPLTRVYLGIAVGVALLTLSQVRDLVTLRHWQSQLAGKRPRAIALGLGMELLAPVAVLLGLPLALGLSFSDLLDWLPDLGYWTVGSALLGFAVAIGKAAVARHHLRARRTPAASRRGAVPTGTPRAATVSEAA